MLPEIMFLSFIALNQCQVDDGVFPFIDDEENGRIGTNTDDDDSFKSDSSGSIYTLDSNTAVQKNTKISTKVSKTNPPLNKIKQENEQDFPEIVTFYDYREKAIKESVVSTKPSMIQFAMNESVNQVTTPYTMDINFDYLQNFGIHELKNGGVRNVDISMETYLNYSTTDPNTSYINKIRKSDTDFDLEALLNISIDNEPSLFSTTELFSTSSSTSNITNSNAKQDLDSIFNDSFDKNMIRPNNEFEIDIPSSRKVLKKFFTTVVNDQAERNFTDPNSQTMKETENTIIRNNSNKKMELKSNFLKVLTNNGILTYTLVSNSSDLTEAKPRPVIFANPIVHDDSKIIASTEKEIQNVNDGAIPGFSKSAFVGVPMNLLLSFLDSKSKKNTQDFDGEQRSKLYDTMEMNDGVVNFIKESARNVGNMFLGQG